MTASEMQMHCRGFRIATQEEMYGFQEVLVRALACAGRLQMLSATQPRLPAAGALKYVDWIEARDDGVYFLRSRISLRPPSEAERLESIVRQRWWASGAYRRQ
ncbi:hypothetical protein LVJ94_35160 [Pendulispora rubella]|uniref:Uncharacterized protein n=1 Tax=Pendulispora rubella TaxID=2741070 RepID=A0ABZ2L0M1_9BACT